MTENRKHSPTTTKSKVILTGDNNAWVGNTWVGVDDLAMGSTSTHAAAHDSDDGGDDQDGQHNHPYDQCHTGDKEQRDL